MYAISYRVRCEQHTQKAALRAAMKLFRIGKTFLNWVNIHVKKRNPKSLFRVELYYHFDVLQLEILESQGFVPRLNRVLVAGPPTSLTFVCRGAGAG